MAQEGRSSPRIHWGATPGRILCIASKGFPDRIGPLNSHDLDCFACYPLVAGIFVLLMQVPRPARSTSLHGAFFDTIRRPEKTEAW